MTAEALVPARVDLPYHWCDNLRVYFVMKQSDGTPIMGLDEGSLKLQVKVHPLADDVLFEGSSEDEEIIAIGNEVAIDIPITPGQGTQSAYYDPYYDLQYTDPAGGIRTLIRGRLLCTEEVTT
jgi:hypothetical protein